MLRGAAGVIVGFLMMAAVVFATIAAITLLAPGFVFDAATARPTAGYVAYGLATGFLAALAGGFMCSFIAERPVRNPVLALVALVVLMGTGEIIASRLVEAPGAASAITPLWYQAAVMLIGVTGVLLAAKLSRRWNP